MGELSLKAHDRLPAVEATLGFAGGFAADLSAALTVHFIMKSRTAPGAPKVNAVATIVDRPTGSVRYDWAAGDTDTPGVYNAEWQVTYNDGRKRTFPTLSYHTITILSDLDNG